MEAFQVMITMQGNSNSKFFDWVRNAGGMYGADGGYGTGGLVSSYQPSNYGYSGTQITKTKEVWLQFNKRSCLER